MNHLMTMMIRLQQIMRFPTVVSLNIVVVFVVEVILIYFVVLAVFADSDFENDFFFFQAALAPAAVSLVPLELMAVLVSPAAITTMVSALHL